MKIAFEEWTKRLGQKHWAIPGHHETLCGMPMLGNNYADVYKEDSKIACEKCHDKREEIEG